MTISYPGSRRHARESAGALARRPPTRLLEDGRIWVRDLRRLEALPVPGTEEGVVPFWSPDGEWLGFTAQESLWKIHLDGSGKTTIAAPGAGATSGGTEWLADGRIVFTTGGSEIFEVSDRGGDPKVLVPLEEGEADFHFVGALPDGKGFLTSVHRGDIFDTLLHIGMDGQRRELVRFEGEMIGQIIYSPTGHLIFGRWSGLTNLWAAPFSLESLSLTGEAFPVAAGAGLATISPDGTLAYTMMLPKIDSEIVTVNRSGQIVGRLSAPTPGIYPNPALSPDGKTVVVPVAGRARWDL